MWYCMSSRSATHEYFFNLLCFLFLTTFVYYVAWRGIIAQDI